jgi:hypothetical protein
MSAQQLTVLEGQTLCDDWRGKTDNEKGIEIGGLKGFLIPTDAIADLKNNPDVEGIRVYLAYDNAAAMVKLVVVGTKDDGTGNQEDIIGTAPNTMIYDFTEPCPTNCDMGSPLF